MSIAKRLAKLEQSAPAGTGTKKITIIGTALAVTANEPHTITSDNMVTFHSHTLKAAYAMREAWLAEQKDVVALVAPMDTGDRALEVHTPAWLDDVEVR